MDKIKMVKNKKRQKRIGIFLLTLAIFVGAVRGFTMETFAQKNTSHVSFSVIDNQKGPNLPITVPNGKQNYLIGVPTQTTTALLPKLGFQKKLFLSIIGCEIVLFGILLILLFWRKKESQQGERKHNI